MTHFRLAHLSDPHLGPLPRARGLELFSKRIIGHINWHRNRVRYMSETPLEALVEDITLQAPDHIAVTGDLVNIALPGEFATARTFLEDLGPPDRVSFVPGNHDAYVPGALARGLSTWAPYMLGDDATDEAVRFPYVRRRDGIALVGVSTAIASPPGFATGTLGRAQSDALAPLLAELGGEGLFRVLLIHHPPVPGRVDRRKRLTDAARVRAAIAAAGCELVLYGHIHKVALDHVPGPNGQVPVLSVPSASSSGLKETPARYNLFEIDITPDGFGCMLIERGWREMGGPVVEITNAPLAIPQPQRARRVAEHVPVGS